MIFVLFCTIVPFCDLAVTADIQEGVVSSVTLLGLYVVKPPSSILVFEVVTSDVDVAVCVFVVVAGGGGDGDGVVVVFAAAVVVAVA